MGAQYIDFLERQIQKDAQTIKKLTETLNDIASWGTDNGAHWCREHARKTLNSRVES